MRKLIILCTITLAFSTIGFSQNEDATYRNTLQEMFEVSGSEETYKAAITQIMGMFKQQYANVEAEQWNQLEQEFLSRSIDELVELLVPVYQKYLTQEDLKEIIAFYETPVGKKFALHNPAIVQESMQVGQQWGMKIGQELQQKLEEEGN